MVMHKPQPQFYEYISEFSDLTWLFSSVRVLVNIMEYLSVTMIHSWDTMLFL